MVDRSVSDDGGRRLFLREPHAAPFLGAINAGAALTVCRDGIKSVVDTRPTVCERGERPDELAASRMTRRGVGESLARLQMRERMSYAT